MALITDVLRPILMMLTTVLYGVLITVLLRGRKTVFSSSFYSLFASTGIADMVNLLMRLLMMDMPSLFFSDEWLSLSNEMPLATMVNALIWYITYVQILGLLAITMNRFSAVALPLWYKKFWTSGTLKVILLVQWVFSIVWALPMVFPCCQSSYFDNDTSNMYFDSEAINNIYSIVDSVVEALICAPFVVLLNILTVVVSIKNRLQISNSETEIVSARKNAEMRLAIVGIITSVSFVCSVVFGSLWSMASSQTLPLDADEMSNWYYNFFDIFTMCNPYILLVLSAVTRAEFFRFIVCKRFSNEGNNFMLSQAGTSNTKGSSVQHIRVNSIKSIANG